MKYAVYKLYFGTGLHIGNRSLIDGEYIINSDTIFSALCHEALKAGGKQYIEKLIDLAKNNSIHISDTMPFIKDNLYVPKPLKPVAIEEQGDSIKKKAFKKLKYIPIQKLNTYMKGNLDPEAEVNIFSELGKYEVKTQVWITGTEETKPYSVGIYKFNENNGLYIVVGYNDNKDLDFIESLILSLSYTGIGGKRSSGLGKFDIEVSKSPVELIQRLNEQNANSYMTISSCMAKETEIEHVLNDAYYLLNKRSGFVSSTNYAEGNLKKKDFYVFKSGSCFKVRFSGDIYDVSHKGNHPVYRYSKPMFLGVN